MRASHRSRRETLLWLAEFLALALMFGGFYCLMLLGIGFGLDR